MRPPEPTPESAVRAPRLNGRYVIARLLGKGAQARVYLGWDTRLKLWRAVKVLAPNFLDDEDVRARFDQEARAMARLSHPNLVRVVDVDHDSGSPYMVMELARGGALTDWMKRNGPIPPVLACRIAQQCAHGLTHAHAVGVVHRDVKPHNVLIREDASVMLTDFGIAQVSDGASLTATGAIMGTFAFMAPEQRTDAKTVDQRADVYSLGASLYTMLTAKTSADLFFADAHDAILEGVTDALRPVILKACRYDRDQRFQTMPELSEALEELIEQLPPDREVPSLAESLVVVPESVPDWVDPASNGLEELRRVLMAGVSPEPPTFVPPDSDRAGPKGASGLRSPQNVPPAGGPGRTFDGSSPASRAGRSRAPEAEPPANRATYRMPAPVRAPEMLPEYIDAVTTMDDPRPERQRAAVQPEPPRPKRPVEPPRRSLRGPIALVAVAGLLLFVALATLVTTGLAAKLHASHGLEVASVAMIEAATSEQSVLSDLAVAGANRERLDEAWDAFEAAQGSEEKALRAAAFAEIVEQEAAIHPLSVLAQAKVSSLAHARRGHARAEAWRDVVRSSLFARMTGELGL